MHTSQKSKTSNKVNETPRIHELEEKEIVNISNKPVSIMDEPISSNVLSMCTGCSNCGAYYNES